MEFICSAFDISYSELARAINTTPQNINTWLRYGQSKSGRKISQERLEQLSEHFNLPEYLFQKELTPEEEIKIKLLKEADIPFDQDIGDYWDHNYLENLINESSYLLEKSKLEIENSPDEGEELAAYLKQLTRFHAYLKNNIDVLAIKENINIRQKHQMFGLLTDMVELFSSFDEMDLSDEKMDEALTHIYSHISLLGYIGYADRLTYLHLILDFLQSEKIIEDIKYSREQFIKRTDEYVDIGFFEEFKALKEKYPLKKHYFHDD